MPEKKGKKPTANGHHDTPDKPAAVYFKSLTIRDVKCFRGEHTIDLSDGEGRPAQWTVILGNNNTGKTTLLKCLAGLEVMGDFKLTEKTSIWKLIRGNPVNVDLMFKPKGITEWSELIFRVDGFFHLASEGFSGNFRDLTHNWHFGTNSPLEDVVFNDPEFLGLKIEAYGASRKMAHDKIINSEPTNRHSSLFKNEDIENIEEWLLQAHLARFQGDENTKERASKIINKAGEILTSGLLPDVKKIWFKSEDKGQSFDNYLAFETDFGQIRLRDLGYGYQTMLAWVLDLVRRMFERYPDSPNPIREPAIVLVDEIDLHLHPEWQRKIIAHLTKYFPNTQFIVTAHSPLVVQSAEKINLVLLEKEGDHVNIRQPKIPTYQGWSLEEILTDVMGLDDRTHSDVYLDLYDRFEKAVEAEDYEAAQAAYEGLVKIVHPSSHLPKLLRLRMSSLMPA